MINDKCVLFDFGGTLDTNGIHWSIMFFNEFEKLGLESNFEKFSKSYTKSDKHLLEISPGIKNYKSLLREQIFFMINDLTTFNSCDNAILTNDVLNEIWNDVSSSLDNSVNLLRNLKHKYDIGLVSNFYGNLQAICRDLCISDYFKVILDSRNAGIEKPHPGIFSLALKKLSALPENTYIVGDSYDRDIVPSKILGCKTIWLNNKSWKKQSTSYCADYIIGDLSELYKILI